MNGKTIVRLGTTADPQRDHIFVDGRPIQAPAPPLYFVLNKPRRVVSTLDDPQGRTTVRELLSEIRGRIFPVGRLDYDSAGLLVLTNDGALTKRLLHPSSRIPRTYHAKVRGLPDQTALARLRQGVRLADGTKAAPARVGVLRGSPGHTWLELTLREGRNREVRRMCQSIGYPVDKLIRVRFGPLFLKDLPTGAYRALTPIEIRALHRLVRLPAPART